MLWMKRTLDPFNGVALQCRMQFYVLPTRRLGQRNRNADDWVSLLPGVSRLVSCHCSSVVVQFYVLPTCMLGQRNRNGDD